MKPTTLILCTFGLLIFLIAIGLYINQMSEKYELQSSAQPTTDTLERRLLDILPYSQYPKSYFGLNDAYGDYDNLIHLPPTVTTYKEKNRSVSPIESGMNIHRSAYKVGMKPQKVIGSFGIGYTDELAACETCM